MGKCRGIKRVARTICLVIDLGLGTVDNCWILWTCASCRCSLLSCRLVWLSRQVSWKFHFPLSSHPLSHINGSTQWKKNANPWAESARKDDTIKHFRDHLIRFPLLNAIKVAKWKIDFLLWGYKYSKWNMNLFSVEPLGLLKISKAADNPIPFLDPI